ncbi:hypothetical protein EBT31_20845, partial [bacterium]|nr:hypothetical protein [bacterium]
MPQTVNPDNWMNNATKARHARLLNVFINYVTSVGSLQKIDLGGLVAGAPTFTPQTAWPWGQLGNRLASKRSADGMVFPLVSRSPGGTKLVCKIIFARDDSAMNEIKIQKILGGYRIAPKIYDAYRVFPIDTPQQMYDQIKALNGTVRIPGSANNRVNLFMRFWDPARNFRTSGFTRAFIIIMENMYDNPVSHVTGGKTLTEAKRSSEKG